MAVLAASGLQMTLPSWLAFGPHWLLPSLEIALLGALVASSPGQLERRSAALRVGGLALAGLLSLTNATFAVLLVGDLARGGGTRSAAALLGLRANGPRPTLALGLLQATSLPFIVTATQIGVALGKLSSVTAAALVCAGLLSVLIFPLIALGLLRRDQPGSAAVPDVTAPVAEAHLM
jgi:hypothetical protein